MKFALENEEDPADASLERVMPGVHERLKSITTSVEGLTRKIDTVHNTFSDSLQAGLDSMARLASDALRESSVILGTSLIDAGASMLNSSPSRRTAGGTSCSNSPDGERSGESEPALDLNSNPPTTTADSPDENLRGLYDFRFQAKYSSLQSVYEHWLGIGDYADDPFGGCAGRNAKYGGKWRKEASFLDSTTYSRVNRIIKAVGEQAKARGEQPEAIVSEWEPLFELSRHSLHNFVEGLKQLNIIRTTKTRGRNKKKED